MYAQVRNMRVISATFCRDDEGHGDRYVVDLDDGKNTVHLYDVAKIGRASCRERV